MRNLSKALMIEEFEQLIIMKYGTSVDGRKLYISKLSITARQPN
jgi:hypothetical protein